MTNSKSTKRAWLGSVVALLLCLAMLIGTTFAWFTDSASTGVNTVQSGNLDMEVYHKVDGEWVLIDEATDLFANVNGDPILWEPGVTATETFMVKNVGNLAFKYAFYLNYANATETADGKTLADVLEYDLPGMVNTSNENTHLEGFKYEGVLTANGAEETLTVELKWNPTDHDNDYNVEGGLSIDLGVKVFATQYTYEYDSIDNQYDKDATLPDIWDGTSTEDLTADEDGVYHITNAAEFVAYMTSVNKNDGKEYYKVVLDCDIDLGGHTYEVSGTASGFSGSFDGQNHTVSNYVIKRADDKHYTGLFSISSWAQDGRNTYFKNLTVKNGTVISNGSQVSAILPNVENGATVENCHAIGCTVIGNKKVGAIAGYNATGTVKDCSATDCKVYAAVKNDKTAADQQEATVYGYNNNGTFTNNAEPVNCIVKSGVKSYVGGTVNISSSEKIGYVADATVTVAAGEAGYHRIYSGMLFL